MMKRIVLNAVMASPLVVAVFCLCAIHCCTDKTLQDCDTSANGTSPQRSQFRLSTYQPTNPAHAFQHDGMLICDMQAGLAKWNGDSQYIMQWDETKKKLVFNGRAIPHACGATTITTVRGTVCGLTKFSGDMKDEYSFDVPSAEEIRGDHVADRSAGQNGAILFDIQWNQEKQRFLINGLTVDDRNWIVWQDEQKAHWNGTGRFRIEKPVEPPVFYRAPRPRDAHNVEPRNYLAVSGMQYGQVDYRIEWDETKMCFLIDGAKTPPLKSELFSFCSGGIWR
jgi:hypothetical protein